MRTIINVLFYLPERQRLTISLYSNKIVNAQEFKRFKSKEYKRNQ